MKAVIKRNPMWNELPNMFDQVFNDWAGGSVQHHAPAVNVKEDKEAFRLEVAAPGYTKTDFNIQLDHNLLTISSERKHEAEEKAEGYTRKEFSLKSFKRSFNLPENTIDADKINAKYENGILSIELPKREEEKAKAARAIEIG